MNVTLNRLPTLTWNHLKMNRSTVAVSGSFTPHQPQLLSQPEEVRWEPAVLRQSPAAWGLSPDVSALTAEAPLNLLETAPGITMTQPAVLRFDYKDGEQAVSRLALHAARDSVLSVVLAFTSPASSRGVSALQLEIEAEDNASVQIYAAQLLSDGDVCLHDWSGVCGRDARISLTRLELGAARAYTGMQVDLQGRQSRFAADIAYYIKTSQLLDMNYVALHKGKKTDSLMTVNGTLEEGARKIFRGTIDFRKGCAGATGNETENVLLMGEELVNQTIPLILCKEEDVEGNHGASIGQLDEKVLFYLGSRGISRDYAQQMIARSRIEAVCAKIPDESVRTLVHNFENRGVTSDDELV